MNYPWDFHFDDPFQHLHRVPGIDEESNAVSTNPGCGRDAGSSKIAG